MIDSHAHFDAAPFADGPDTAIREARAAGVEGAFNPAVDLASTRRILALNARHPDFLWPGAGFHPLYLDGWSEEAARDLETIAARPEVAAVGEVGLDFWHGRGDEERQREALHRQARIARALGLPLALHIRKAFYETLACLREAGFDGPAVCHAFSGSPDMAAKALDRGFYLSASATLTYPRKAALRELFARLPAERILVETDAPDLPPWERRGEIHHPRELPRVVEALAAARGEPVDVVAAQTAENALRLFGRRAGGEA